MKAICVLVCALIVPLVAQTTLPPAIPLITIDPLVNAWSFGRELTGTMTTLWDGTIKCFIMMARVDGTAYRLVGPSAQDGGAPAEAMPQLSLSVMPTTTVAVFGAGGVQVTVTFRSTHSFVGESLDIFSWPITYISFDVTSTDGNEHTVELYYDNTAEISVNAVSDEVEFDAGWLDIDSNSEGAAYMRIGTTSQKVFDVSGDFVGLDWGYAYVTALQDDSLTMAPGFGSNNTRWVFASTGRLPMSGDVRNPRACDDDWPVLALSWDLGTVSPSAPASKFLVFGYDDIYSIAWFTMFNLPAYWKKDGANITDVLSMALEQYSNISSFATNFDQTMWNALYTLGGDNYASVGAASFRQALGGMKLTYNADAGLPWYFLKEISSDGDLSTVDVIFPASPILLVLRPELLVWQILPILAYANNETIVPYTFEFAPHHLGYYPVGYITPAQQENMPIEETGNLILMLAAAVQRDPSTFDLVYPKYWPLLEQWATYLSMNLPDPGNQLCTDDFEGPSPHNANLAAKGIIALDAFALLCDAAGQTAMRNRYHNLALDYAQAWTVLANGTDHSLLEFYADQSTFSLKYNMLYQYILGLNTFDASVMARDIQYYISQQLRTYGVPLDNRALFTKLDWMSWVAAMGTQEQFDTLMNCVTLTMGNTSPSLPLTDWYNTTNAKQIGFQARPVVGGVFARMVLYPAEN